MPPRKRHGQSQSPRREPPKRSSRGFGDPVLLQEIKERALEAMRQRDRNVNNQPPVQKGPRQLSLQEIKERALKSMRQKRERDASKRTCKAETTQDTSTRDDA